MLQIIRNLCVAASVLIRFSFVLEAALEATHRLLVVMVVWYLIEWRLPLNKKKMCYFRKLHISKIFSSFILFFLLFWCAYYVFDDDETSRHKPSRIAVACTHHILLWLTSTHTIHISGHPETFHLWINFLMNFGHLKSMIALIIINFNGWYHILGALIGCAFEYCSLENSITS